MYLGFSTRRYYRRDGLSPDRSHLTVRELWFPRHDQDLEQERAKRRKDQQKCAKEMWIEELRIWEAEGYRTGLGSSLYKTLRRTQPTHLFFVPVVEVPGLTHEINIELFRGLDAGYPQVLRYIRISNTDPDKVTVSRSGR